MRCRDCLFYFEDMIDDRAGTCRNDKIGTGMFGEKGLDGLMVDDYMFLFVGKNFGCVHFKNRMEPKKQRR